MTALLILVHGSPTPGANDALEEVVTLLRARGAYGRIEIGYMECNAPSIPEAIDDLAGGGAREIIAVPYFLHTGTHVCDDLPTLLEEGKERHPTVSFRLGEYLGLSEALTRILSERARG